MSNIIKNILIPDLENRNQECINQNEFKFQNNQELGKQINFNSSEIISQTQQDHKQLNQEKLLPNIALECQYEQAESNRNEILQKIAESEQYFECQQQGDSGKSNNNQIDKANQIIQPQYYAQKSQIDLEQESRSNKDQLHISIQSFKEAPLTRDSNQYNIIEDYSSQDTSYKQVQNQYQEQEIIKEEKIQKKKSFVLQLESENQINHQIINQEINQQNKLSVRQLVNNNQEVAQDYLKQQPLFQTQNQFQVIAQQPSVGQQQVKIKNNYELNQEINEQLTINKNQKEEKMKMFIQPADSIIQIQKQNNLEEIQNVKNENTNEINADENQQTQFNINKLNQNQNQFKNPQIQQQQNQSKDDINQNLNKNFLEKIKENNSLFMEFYKEDEKICDVEISFDSSVLSEFNDLDFSFPQFEKDNQNIEQKQLDEEDTQQKQKLADNQNTNQINLSEQQQNSIIPVLLEHQCEMKLINQQFTQEKDQNHDQNNEIQQSVVDTLQQQVTLNLQNINYSIGSLSQLQNNQIQPCLKAQLNQEIQEIEAKQENLQKLYQEQYKIPQECFCELQKRGYIITRYLSKGGFGQVLKGFDKINQIEVAIKISFTNQNETFENMKSEKIIIDQIKCYQYVVKTFDLFIIKKSHIIVQIMEYCCTGLQNYIQNRRNENNPLKKEEIIDIFFQLINALVEIHANGIVHLDIKPLNILRNSDGIYKLTDFGISQLLKQDHNSCIEKVKGLSPKYCSPEQYQLWQKQSQIDQKYNSNINLDSDNNDYSISQASDVFSMGLTFLYILQLDLSKEIANKIRNGEFEFYLKTQDLSKISFLTFIRYYMLCQNPGNRYTSLQLKPTLIYYFPNEKQLFYQDFQRIQEQIKPKKSSEQEQATVFEAPIEIFEQIKQQFEGKDNLFPPKILCSIYDELQEKKIYLTSFLAQGGQGMIFEAKMNNQVVIVKCLQVKNEAQIIEEMNILEQIKHIPNVCEIIKGIKSFCGSRYYQIFKKYSCDLSSVMQFLFEQKKTLSLNSIVGIALLVSQVILSLPNMFHSDLKPKNILYDKLSQNFVLSDFGAAKQFKEGSFTKNVIQF
ncbi:hypothetical protein ABPG72_017855 [Tetrahymena utriculariae]